MELDLDFGPDPHADLQPVDLRHRRMHEFVKRPEGKRGCSVCGKAKAHLSHLGCPPSLNVGGSGSDPYEYQRVKKQWQERFTDMLEASSLPRDGSIGYVYVEGQVCFPDRIARDQGNYRYYIEKCLGDALDNGGWIEKDDWTRYEFGKLRCAYERGEAWLALTLYPHRERMQIEEFEPVQQLPLAS